ncbi:unnamed protein product [Rotaria sordida]|uniref:Uncharacterized protein n=1 Tax=Rotaria sordida TaxID=392033 RepID=A0A819FQC7_9BILA|nr:unnamed protein product [Rotaria sordida]
MTDAQIHIGLYSMDKLPEYFQLFRQTSINLILYSYIPLLTCHYYYNIYFIIKNPLNHCMQPKIQRFISKLSTPNDLNQQDTTDQQFH